MFYITKRKYLVPCLFVLLLVCVITLYHTTPKEYKHKTHKESTTMTQKDSTPHLTQSYTLTTQKSTVPSTNTIRGHDDIFCHYITEGDALPSAEDANFSPPTDSIFFHETSCSGELNSRQACAIESAAKAHPNRKIYVLFSGPIAENILHFTRNSFFELKKYPNIEFARVHADAYSKGTALETIITKKEHNASHWKVVHTSDMLRFITLYKYSGLYLDTDMVVVKPLDDLGRNWIARESEVQVNTAALNVAKDELGHEFIAKVLKEVSTSYRPDLWLHNGPGAVNRILSKFCNTTDVEKFSKAACKGFQVYSPELIYPVPYSQYEGLLKTGDLNVDNAYTVHFWNKLSQNMEVEWDSPFDKLAKQHCPVIRELYADSFGF